MFFPRVNLWQYVSKVSFFSEINDLRYCQFNPTAKKSEDDFHEEN